MTRQSEWLNRRWAELLDRYGNRCNACGADEDLEFAHVKPTELNGLGRGKHTRMIDILMHPGCYLLLCVSCHEQLDGETYRNPRNGRRVPKVNHG